LAALYDGEKHGDMPRMSISNATGTWTGDFKTGKGTMKPENGGEIQFSTSTRFEGQKGSNPEEVIGAALAGCFSMALTLGLEKAGIKPESVTTNAKVHLEKAEGGFGIPRIDLFTQVKAPGADAAKFKSVAEETKKGCPVSKLLKADITLEASLT
jgi:lipoyl-dependent peroxiredoxin